MPIRRSYAYVPALLAAFFLIPFSALAATLGFVPVSSAADAGTSFNETVVVTSADQAMNATSGSISFPPDLLQVISITKTNSLLTLWVVDPTFSNTEGTISWSGIVPNPGYIGNRGTLFTIRFRARRAGTAVLSYGQSSQVLANDGNGTNILTGTQTAAITVSDAQNVTPAPTPVAAPSLNTDLLAHITSSTHPDETEWYKLSHAAFDWTNAQGVSGVRLSYDKNADGIPIVVYTEPISHKELDLEDGIWYFHVQEKGTSGWGPIATYRVQIDTIAPRAFTINFPNGAKGDAGSPIAAKFSAFDELSGIDHYEASVDGKDVTVSAEAGSKPFGLTANGGPHVLVVQAFDKAGNMRTEEATFTMTGTAAPSPLFAFGWIAVNYLSFILIALAVLGTLLFGAWYIHVHFSAYRRRLNRQLGLTHAHIHKEFDALKEALADEIRNLEEAKSRRSLTREEEKLVTHFRALIDKSEQAIDKDLEEIPR